MEGWFQIRSSELSSRKLFEVGKVWIVEIGLEVAERGRNGIKPVIGKHDGLRVLEFRERLHVEAIVGVRAVGLRSGEVGAMGNRLACQQADMSIVTTLGEVILAFSRSSRPQRELAVFAEKSSDRDRNTLVRKVCNRVRQLSPGRVDLSELMLWVAMIGMHLGWRDRLKNFSSPVGSLSPTVAKCWYSSQRKRTWRKYCSGWASMSGMRFKTARWKSSFIITPKALAKPGFIPIGKFRAHTAPLSISQLKEGSGTP